MYGRDLNASSPTKYVSNTVTKEHPERDSKRLTEKGEFSKFDLTHCSYAYLGLSIDEAIRHESPIIQMLSVLDKRLGKRRLIKLDEEELHPLVRYFLNLRLSAEGLASKSN